MAELREGLQALVAAHGVGKVYVELYGKMKEDYEFLREFFSHEETPKAKVLRVKKTPEPAVAVEATAGDASTEMSATALKDSKIKIVKREVDPLALFPQPIHVPEVEAESEPVPAPAPALKSPKFATPKEAKAWQKEQELKKKLELEESGVVPLSLLTKANLEQWILKDSRTYAYIAREYVGLPEAVISETAKSFNIQSEVAKKRFQVIKGKKAKQSS